MASVLKLPYMHTMIRRADLFVFFKRCVVSRTLYLFGDLHLTLHQDDIIRCYVGTVGHSIGRSSGTSTSTRTSISIREDPYII